MSTGELAWFKSSYSSGGSGDCVEIATRPHTIHVRDSKNTQGPQLTLSPTTWSAFLTYAGSTSGPSAPAGRG
ncbi:DUF397 domain-containing protein [Streptomyces sp. NBC_00287]|uniref:DUF397 domain-containing protein n=1 Tax=Streptomyces sp. NBC_00287 TaxID=2975702 RepID=UPI002E2CEC09|nr:DUF397 domain-containing protein [Streptomyces sp. NBC_00287]